MHATGEGEPLIENRSIYTPAGTKGPQESIGGFGGRMKKRKRRRTGEKTQSNVKTERKKNWADIP